MTTTTDTSTTALINKAASGLRYMSDLELAAWCALVSDPAAEQDLFTPEGLFRTYARLDLLQEIELRSGQREWPGVFRGFSVYLTRHLLGVSRTAGYPDAGSDAAALVLDCDDQALRTGRSEDAARYEEDDGARAAVVAVTSGSRGGLQRGAQRRPNRVARGRSP